MGFLEEMGVVPERKGAGRERLRRESGIWNRCAIMRADEQLPWALLHRADCLGLEEMKKTLVAKGEERRWSKERP